MPEGALTSFTVFDAYVGQAKSRAENI